MLSCLGPNPSTSNIPAIQYTSPSQFTAPLMPSDSEVDAAGVPWLISSEWTPGKPTGRGRRLTIPPKEALAEIQYLFSELHHDFCGSLPPKLGGHEPMVDWAYTEVRHYMMKLQLLRDELNALKVSKEDEEIKLGLAMAMHQTISKVEGYVEQKKGLGLSHREHSEIYSRAQAQRRAGKARTTQSGCLIS